MLTRNFLFLLLSIFLGLSFALNGKQLYKPGRLIVRVDTNQSLSSLEHITRAIGVTNIHSYDFIEGLQVYEFPESVKIEDAQEKLLESEVVLYAEPDYIYSIDVNDPLYREQWGLENSGQLGGTPDADINAEYMWDIETGSKDVVIGIIDTGIDYTHPDLRDNIWTNPGEIANNNIDDDRNGYIDDMHGINAIENSGDPLDDNIHGTHVAGTIGARGKNNLGVVGVAQKVQLIGCKFLSRTGSGGISDALQCMEYFAHLKTRSENPINIRATNNSWGGGSRSQAMYDAIKQHEELGILFVAAAGNESNNNDRYSRFPSNYQVSNVLSVAATDRFDQLAGFSNYGKDTVHVAAPGVQILSTVLDHGYGELSGTSMAAPHVSGLAAILWSDDSNLDYLGVKNLIMSGGVPIEAAKNTTISGRRIRGADDNGLGSLTCENQELVTRFQPQKSRYKLKLGQELFLSASYINCDTHPEEFIIYDQDSTKIALNDLGLHGDKEAHDGVYSLLWQAENMGNFDLKFGNNDSVHVSVSNQTQPSGYIIDDTIAYEYENIGGQALNAYDESLHWLRSPFPILFNQVEPGYTDLYVGSNGTISFSDKNNPGYNNQTLPYTQLTNLVAPFWDDLTYDASNSDIYVEVVGSAPNRKLVVEYWRVRQYNSSGLGAFQVVFFEESSDVQFNYMDAHFDNPQTNYGQSATVGIQIEPDSAQEYSFNSPAIKSGRSILFMLD